MKSLTFVVKQIRCISRVQASKAFTGNVRWSSSDSNHSNASQNSGSNKDGIELEDSEYDKLIHPDWLAMERRVKFRKPKLKGEGVLEGRSARRGSAWDGENV